MSTKFAPGPWVLAYDDHNGQSVVSSECTEVCTCWHHSVGSLEKQMRANAHLIAAAPDLYEALAKIAADPSNVALYLDCGGRYALAKARGES